MTEPVTVFLGMGANLGDPVSQLQLAIDKLNNHPLISVTQVSAFYRTEPVAAPEQPDFVNCIAEISTVIEPESIMEVCLDIEEQSGRVRGEMKNAPRKLDMDIIFYGDRLIKQDSLTVPHLRYANRRFVLEPLAEIAPDFICPDSNLSVAETLERCGDFSRVELLESEEVV